MDRLRLFVGIVSAYFDRVYCRRGCTYMDTLSLMCLSYPQIALLFGSEHDEIMKVNELQTDATFQDLCNLLQLCLCASKFSRYKVGWLIAILICDISFVFKVLPWLLKKGF